MKETFRHIITDIIKPIMKDNGFKISGNTLHRQEKDFVLIFDIWKSSWNTSEKITFWVEIGVFVESYHIFLLNGPLPKKIRTPECSMRLGMSSILNKDNYKHDYVLTQNNIEQLKAEIKLDLNNSFVPFLNSLREIEDLLILEKLNDKSLGQLKLFVGLLYAEKGNLDKASILVREYLNFARYPLNWVDRIEKECERLKIKT